MKKYVLEESKEISIQIEKEKKTLELLQMYKLKLQLSVLCTLRFPLKLNLQFKYHMYKIILIFSQLNSSWICENDKQN